MSDNFGNYKRAKAEKRAAFERELVKLRCARLRRELVKKEIEKVKLDVPAQKG